ncbi:MAG TPA: citryl-CoA lyase [Acidimicrobiales bacterium]|nr:citryl-CoA lyase [Acidimicrobiales bacterium]
MSDGPVEPAAPGRSALAAHRSGDRAWWETAITDVSNGRIVTRGRPIEDLIGTTSFAQHLVLLFSGRMISPPAAALLEAVMVAGADHGPRAPSIAAARMAATCGVSFNSSVATGINLLGEIHGGAAGNAMRALLAVEERASSALGDGPDGADGQRSDRDGGPGPGLDAAALAYVRDSRDRGEAVAGFGHQLHDLDPRRAPLLALCEAAAADGTIDGRYVEVAMAVERALDEVVGRPVTINIDGLWAIVCCELDLPPDFAMGAFCLSRGAGIVAHAYEEASTGVKIKGPCPPGDDLVRYIGE